MDRKASEDEDDELAVSSRLFVLEKASMVLLIEIPVRGVAESSKIPGALRRRFWS